MSQYIGTISTSCGTISVPRKSTNSSSRPRNRSRANANPDKLDAMTTTAVPLIATRKLLKK